jgi:hypothetical protein
MGDGEGDEILCGACGLRHIGGDFHCTLRCTHCQRQNHSAAQCPKRKQELAFKRSQTKKLKNVLLTNFLRDQERRSEEGQRGHSRSEEGQRGHSQDVRQLDLVHQVRLEEQTRANQAIVNHVYHTRKHDQQNGRVQWDKRGSFTERKEGKTGNVAVQSKLTSDVDFFQGVFDAKFHQDPDFQSVTIHTFTVKLEDQDKNLISVHLPTRYAYFLQLYCDDLCLLVCRA